MITTETAERNTQVTSTMSRQEREVNPNLQEIKSVLAICVCKLTEEGISQIQLTQV